jgi:mannose-1-phosphate guanylyltransferase
VEPAARNTAPAIGLAAAHIAAQDSGAVMQVLPADHAVRDGKRFVACLSAAARLAQRGFLVTLGIRPSRAETGYGYIQIGERIDSDGARVKAFVEKPDAPTARRYLEAGDYLWNSGIFIFRADAILAAFDVQMPEVARGLARVAAAIGKASYRSILAREFPKLPSQSIDYGVMEKAPNIAVVPGDFGWSDLGSFASLAEVRPTDDRGNVVSGRTMALVNCDNCVVFAGKRPIALAGLSDMVVIDAGDVLLVVPKQESQQVRTVVETFRVRGLHRFL